MAAECCATYRGKSLYALHRGVRLCFGIYLGVQQQAGWRDGPWVKLSVWYLYACLELGKVA